jgi:hypothetical protein
MTHKELRGQKQTRMTAVFHKFVTKPLYDYLPTVEKLDIDRLYIGDNDTIYGQPELVRLKNYKVTYNRGALNVIQKRALIVRSKTAAKLYLNQSKYDQGDGWVVYVVGNHMDRRAEAEEMLYRLGYEVHISIPDPVARAKASDDPDYVAPVKKATPKRKGYLTLRQATDGIREPTYLLSTARGNGSVAGQTDPIAWVILENASHYRQGKIFSNLDENICRAVNTLWGDKIAVVTSVQTTALIEKGIPDVKTFINEYVDDALVSRPDFPRYLAFGHKVENMDPYRVRSEQKIMAAMIGHESLMTELGIRFGISAETATLVTFFAKGDHYVKLPKCKALAAKVKESPKFQEILTKLTKSPWAKFIDMDHLGNALELVSPDHLEKSEIPYTILRNLLK